MEVLRIIAEIASIRCARDMKVRELKSHIAIPFLATCIPFVGDG